MIHMIGEKYGEICLQDAKDAHERGVLDEKTVRAIDWIESEGDNSHVTSLSSVKGMSDSSLEEKRRPSTTSTAPTDISNISAASAFVASEEMNRISRMKRAKMFLWKFV